MWVWQDFWYILIELRFSVARIWLSGWRSRSVQCLIDYSISQFTYGFTLHSEKHDVLRISTCDIDLLVQNIADGYLKLWWGNECGKWPFIQVCASSCDVLSAYIHISIWACLLERKILRGTATYLRTKGRLCRHRYPQTLMLHEYRAVGPILFSANPVSLIQYMIGNSVNLERCFT